MAVPEKLATWPVFTGQLQVHRGPSVLVPWAARLYAIRVQGGIMVANPETLAVRRPQPMPSRPRVPPNLFGIAFGLAGLGEAWNAGRQTLGVSRAVPDAIFLLAAVAWLLLITGYAAQGRGRVLADLRHPVLAPFVSLAVIIPMILASALATVAFAAGRALVIFFLAATVAVGGWLTGQWIAGDLDQQSAHPGYFLPTVAGGLLGAAAAAQVHLHAVAETSFGIGVICWLLLGSTILNRLFFKRALPTALLPTLGIEVAPPAVAGVAYFALTGGATNAMARALAGYAVLMALVQVRLLPVYVRLRFTPGFWAFTFSYAALASDALLWISRERPPGAVLCCVAVLVVITGFIAVIAARTVMAAARGDLLPTS
jgi:tellurite resistance protein